MQLDDVWIERGENLEDFCNLMEKMSKSTIYKKTSTAELSLLVYGYETQREYKMLILDSVCINDLESSYATDVMMSIPVNKNAVDKVLLKETLDGAGFMILEDEDCYYVSQKAMSSILARANLNGSGMFRKSLPRNLILEECLYKSGIGDIGGGVYTQKDAANPEDYNCTIVARQVTENGRTNKKIFFLPTEKYIPLPLTVLSEVAEAICADHDMFGRAKVKQWSATNFVSEIALTFPQYGEAVKEKYNLKGDLEPGILIRSSDTGHSCFVIKVIAYINGSSSYITIKEEKRKHSGHVEAEDVLEKIRKIFPGAVKRFVKDLSDLDLQKVVTASVPASRIEKEYEKVCDRIFRTSGITRVIGKKREIETKRNILEEMKAIKEPTAYDLVIQIINTHDYFDSLPETCVDDISAAEANAVYSY